MSDNRVTRQNKMLCKFCSLPCSPEAGDYLQCETCSFFYHTSCASMSSTTFNFFKSNIEYKWNCVLCHSKATNAMLANTILLNDIKKEIFISIDGQLQKFNQSISNFRQEMDCKFLEFRRITDESIVTALAAQDARIVQLEACLKDRIAQGSEKSEHMLSTINHLSSQIDHYEIASRSSNLALTNVPVTADEDLRKIFDKLCQKITFSADPPGCLSSIFRIKSQAPTSSSVKTKPPPILIKFNSSTARDDFFGCYMQLIHLSNKDFQTGLAPTTTDIGVDSAATRIYVNEHLSFRNHKIHEKAVQYLIEKKISKITTSNGIVVVKGRAAKWKKVFSLNDLHAFVANDSPHSTK
jgi:hypothetical protein